MCVILAADAVTCQSAFVLKEMLPINKREYIMVNTAHNMSICGFEKGIREFLGLFCELYIFIFFVIAFDIGALFHFQLEIKNNNQCIIKTSSTAFYYSFIYFFTMFTVYSL